MRIISFVLLSLFLLSPLLAQESGDDLKKEPPSFKLTRAEEDYSYLKEESPYEDDVFDALKYISFNRLGNIYASIGGQFRLRYEHYSNRFWLEEEDQNFYSQRIALHSNLVVSKYFRLFGEVYHGYTSHEKEFAEYDKLDLFQAFAEIKLPFLNKKSLSIRFGRQEMGLGATRLIGIREGPNIRRSFDMLRFVIKKEKTTIQAFYGTEVIPLFDAFDNRFSLFNNENSNPVLWGLYTQFPIKGLNGTNELYYLGFEVASANFADVSGAETRHTIGLRRFGKIGRHWKYNSELIYQFGTIGDNNISAFSIDTDWRYELRGTRLKWSPGLKLEYASGDKDAGDGSINSFNPMFVNPAFYNLAATITPVNIFGVHPSVSCKPNEDVKLYLEWAMFWRASSNDALYRPTRFINRPAEAIESKRIGQQFGLKIQYELNRNTSFDLDMSYFSVGSFLNESAEADPIFHIAPTMSIKF